MPHTAIVPPVIPVVVMFVMAEYAFTLTYSKLASCADCVCWAVGAATVIVSVLAGEPVPLIVNDPDAVQFVTRICSLIPVLAVGAVMPVIVAAIAVAASNCCSPFTASIIILRLPFAAVADIGMLCSLCLFYRISLFLGGSGFLWRNLLLNFFSLRCIAKTHI